MSHALQKCVDSAHDGHNGADVESLGQCVASTVGLETKTKQKGLREGGGGGGVEAWGHRNKALYACIRVACGCATYGRSRALGLDGLFSTVVSAECQPLLQLDVLDSQQRTHGT